VGDSSQLGQEGNGKPPPKIRSSLAAKRSMQQQRQHQQHRQQHPQPAAREVPRNERPRIRFANLGDLGRPACVLLFCCALNGRLGHASLTGVWAFALLGGADGSKQHRERDVLVRCRISGGLWRARAEMAMRFGQRREKEESKKKVEKGDSQRLGPRQLDSLAGSNLQSVVVIRQLGLQKRTGRLDLPLDDDRVFSAVAESEAKKNAFRGP
jgi:hypothetical protein